MVATAVLLMCLIFRISFSLHFILYVRRCFIGQLVIIIRCAFISVCLSALLQKGIVAPIEGALVPHLLVAIFRVSLLTLKMTLTTVLDCVQWIPIPLAINHFVATWVLAVPGLIFKLHIPLEFNIESFVNALLHRVHLKGKSVELFELDD